MRVMMSPFFFIGRVLLWVFLLPVGIWRSVVNRRKKEARRRERFEREQQKRQHAHERALEHDPS
jgi:cytochrome c-type biogenesis protein CcmH/NrfF